MRALITLALLLPAVAWGAPSWNAWQERQGSRVEVEFMDGSRVTGRVLEVTEDQAKVRKDDGSLTLVPLAVVAALHDPPEATDGPYVYGSSEAPPPPPTPVEPVRQRGGPQIGLGVGVGMGPVSVGVGTSTGGGRDVATAPQQVGGRYKRDLVAVRYPLFGGDLVDALLFDDTGAPTTLPDEVQRQRALRQYQFVDAWGQVVPWQVAWAGMGAERDYLAEVKKVNQTMVPLRVTENALIIGGLGLVIYSFVQQSQQSQSWAPDALATAGTAMSVSGIVFSVAVTSPVHNAMLAKIGRKGLDKAQAQRKSAP